MPRAEIASTIAKLRAEFGVHPFASADAVDIGISKGRLNSAVRSGALTRTRRGALFVADDSSLAQLGFLENVQAICTTMPLTVVSHDSAARLLGLAIIPRRHLWAEPDLITITTPDGSHVGRHGYRIVSADLPEADRTFLGGIPITTIARTAVDIARGSDFRGALTACDSAMRLMVLAEARRLGIPEREAVHLEDLQHRARTELMKVAAGMTRWSGIRNARRAILAAHPAAESPLESVSRALMIENEIPVPKINWPIVVDGVTRYADFYWDDKNLIGEADGKLKYVVGDAVYQEKLRQDGLHRLGIEVERWGWDEAYRHPDRLIAQLRPYFF
jgi:GNAT superfamily N-acetyltransferase